MNREEKLNWDVIDENSARAVDTMRKDAMPEPEPLVRIRASPASWRSKLAEKFGEKPILTRSRK